MVIAFSLFFLTLRGPDTLSLEPGSSIEKQKGTLAYTLMALFAQRDSESFITGDWSQYIGKQKRTVAYTQMVLFALRGSDTCITEHWSQSVKIK